LLQKSSCFQLLLKTLAFHKVVYRHILGAVGSLVIVLLVLLHMFWFWQWKKIEIGQYLMKL